MFHLILSGQIPRSLLRICAEDYTLRMSERILKSDNVSVLVYHLVCPAKYRRVVFDEAVDEVLRPGSQLTFSSL